MLDCSPGELEALLSRGWRRFGPDYFRPRCGPCDECVPTRVPIAAFTSSKSQRRARAKCAALRAVVGPPTVDDERLALYHRWHAARERARGWSPVALDEEDYLLSFALPHPAVREVAYYEGHALVGVGICDETPRAWSAVYFYYEPAWGDRSIGVANVLAQIEIARERRLDHLYLGYRVDGCPSMAYKARYRPQERLVGWPGLDEAPRWERRVET
jgi:arginyl-tRNA--protein-N-Asp/Glu arginylyltransferase